MMREEPIITEQYSAPKGLTVKAYLTVEEESSQEECSPLVDAE
jgi:hypothetical protein